MTVYQVYIFLASGEWGNETMRRIADEYAAQHAERPLIVAIYEHAGWHLSYLYGAPAIADGTICGTANDAANLSQAVQDFGRTIARVQPLGEIRR